MADKIFNLTNGVSYGARYTVQATDETVAAVAEVIKVKVLTGCTVNGNVTVTIRGGTPQVIAVTTAADLATEVATLIAGGTYTGWTDVASTDTVTFTASAAGAKTGATTVDVAATGVTVEISTFTLGADAIPGFVNFKFKSSDKETLAPYPLAGKFLVTTAAGVNVDLADAIITYPENGCIKLTDGAATFALAATQVISLVAQRADISVA